MYTPITLAVVGDSAASGVGDSDDQGNYFGWTYHLAKAFQEPLVYINASRLHVIFCLKRGSSHLK